MPSTVSPTVVCCVCGRKQRDDPGLLPAQERYVGAHIKEAAARAAERGLPFFIISGVFGFIAADRCIPCSDHKLTEQEVYWLTLRINGQLSRLKIEEILFYTKDEADLAPYRKALEYAAGNRQIKVTVNELTDYD